MDNKSNLYNSDLMDHIKNARNYRTISGQHIFAEGLNPLCGDRFEIFSAVSAAMIARIPVAHCHGGEATEGLIDESIRHSITKMSHIHFCSTNEYKKRIIQLGESPKLVHNVGALGIENINKLSLLSKVDLENSISFKLNGDLNFLVTFHPVTLENSTSSEQVFQLLQALDLIENCKIIFTKSLHKDIYSS